MDEDYRGNLGVILYNHSDIPYIVSRGDLIAHLICQKIYYSILEEVKILYITERGEGGFGSIDIIKNSVKMEYSGKGNLFSRMS